jgi:hypothetical protein
MELLTNAVTPTMIMFAGARLMGSLKVSTIGDSV